MLAFLPWLRITEPIREGQFHLFPQGVSVAPPDGVASKVSVETTGKVLSQYRDSPKRPLQVVTVLQYDGRPLGTDLDEADRAAVFQFGKHLAVSGLSDRRFIGGFPDGYTAAGHYQVVIQAFTEPYRDSVSLTHRRKGGHTNVLMGHSDVHFVRPAHLVSQGEPNLNLRLLTALTTVASLPQGIREHIDASVTQFLLANSDSPDVSLEVESIATYAALERVSDASQRLQDIQVKLPAILAMVDDSPWAELLHRELKLAAPSDRSVLHTWLQHMYRLRGNAAHGKPEHWQSNGWSQQEHLVAGAFVYPLVLKCLLAKHRRYSLNEEDVAWVLGLEKLLGDRPFFEPPAESLDSNEPSDGAAPDTLVVRDAQRPRMTRWQFQFENINNALFGLALSGTIRETLSRLESDALGGAMGDA